MGDAADHLSESCELLGLQELRMKNALGGEVAINFDAPHLAAWVIEDGPRRAVENPRRRTQHIQLFAQAAAVVAGKLAPAFSEPDRLSGMALEAVDQVLKRFDF